MTSNALYRLASAVTAVGFFMLPAMAQTTAPVTTAPATQPRRVMTMPSGFGLVEVGSEKVICEPADKTWVRDALKDYQPATHPTTMPADLLQQYQANRPAVLQMMGKDLGVQDTTPIAQWLDEHLLRDLRKYDELKAPIFYITTTEPKLSALVRDGQWSYSGVGYNRITKQLEMREWVVLRLDTPMDDYVRLALYEPEDDTVRKSTRLRDAIQADERNRSSLIGTEAMQETQIAMAEVLMKQVFADLKLPENQLWLANGLAGALSADYTAPLTGQSKNGLRMILTAELRRNPLRLATIDLLNPTNPRDLREQYIPHYFDAYRRKAVRVGVRILDKAREKVPALIASLKEKPCATPEELIKRVAAVTGVDISADVGPR